MTTTRDDRERAVEHRHYPHNWRSYDHDGHLTAFVERDDRAALMVFDDILHDELARSVEAFRAHREAAERATVERIASRVNRVDLTLLFPELSIERRAYMQEAIRMVALTAIRDTRQALLLGMSGEAKGGERT